jgi:hypothetical protein
MKRALTLIFLAALTLALISSCSKDNPAEPLQPKPPTVSTKAASAITHTTAESGGTITSDGGAEVTARGVCWSTAAGPTIADDTTSDGAGSGSFTSTLIGLTFGTPYFVRAYATNSAGTGYGTAETFTTTAPSYLTLSSSFDSDAEGWTVSGGSLYYRGSDGSAGGFVEFEDNEDQCGFFTAPSKFRGDLTAFDQGTLSFDIKNTYDNSGFMLGCYGDIKISSGSLYAERNIVPYDSFFSDWTSFSIPMTAHEWGVTPEQWDSILTNATDIIFYMDAQMAYSDRTGLDNFCLTSQDLNMGSIPKAVRSRSCDEDSE